MSGRTCLLTMCVITLWVALVVRLVQVQCLDQYGLANIVDRQRSYCEVLRARPGDLLDRHGGLLVTTVETFSLFVDPRLLTDTDTAARELSRITGEHTVRLVERLRERHESRFLWVARHLSVETARQARRLNLPPGSWGLRSEFHRVYPQGTLAAHLIGWRNIDGVGQSGLERVLEGRLRGIDGSRTLLRDARGFVIEVTSDPGRPAVNGPDISLTIDTVIQLFAEEAIDVLQEQWNPRSAVAIVMEPQTGEILAMAARPTFDPHHPGDVASRHWLNPAVSLAFEPGSTLKPLFVARALDAGLVRRDEMVDCGGGTYQMGSRTLHDHHPYGALSLGDVLVKSSNIGMARIGERLTNSGLHQALRDFGFGKPTQLGLPSESPGFVRPLSEWTAYSTGSVPMGQEVAVTPVQLITAFSALANGGRMIAPRLVRDTAGSSADSSAPDGDAGGQRRDFSMADSGSAG